MDTDLEKNILKTGTSLVGIVCKEGIVLASDRKVTLGGQIVADKDFLKTEQINEYLVMSFSGTLSDAKFNNRIIAAQLKLKELRDKKRPTVRESASFISTMKFQGIRQPSMIPPIVGNLVAGYNADGSVELYSVSPDGAILRVMEYDASGSGMVYIWGLLERQFKKGMSITEGINLAIESIKSSSERDTASGSGIDVFTITKEGIKHVSKQKAENRYIEQ